MRRHAPVLPLRVPLPLAGILLLALAPALAQTNVPSIAFLSPASAPVGSPPIVVVVTGLNFTPGSVVLWNGVLVSSTYVSANQLSASITANLLAAAGSATVQVMNFDLLRSNTVLFSIVPSAISITTTTLPAATARTSYTAALSASGGALPYTWSNLDALPPGLTLSGNGVLSGVPSLRGTFNFSVRVADANQQSATKTLSLAVNDPQLAITTAPSLPPAQAGVEYSVTLAAENASGALRWQLGSGAPSGLQLNSSTGVLSGVPAERGTYTFQVQVADSVSTATKTFTLVVQRSPLAITTVSPLFSGTVGVQYAQTFSARGGAPPYRWSMEPAVPGLTLDPGNGTLTGTPQTAGSFSIQVQVRDNEGSTVTQPFVLDILAPRVTIITGSALPGGTVGVQYSVRFTASGGAAPYSWSILSRIVPGLALNAETGTLEGVPSAPDTYGMTVQARDATGVIATKFFTVAIAPAALKITPLSDPLRGTVTTQFSAELSASGGVPPYAWSTNGLPAGLSIDPATGAVSGTPTTGGTFLFTARVTDSANAFSTELFEITIGFPAAPALTAINVPATARPAEQLRIQLRLDSPYALPLTGQLLLGFSPDSGTGDATIQFSTGGRSADFTIPAGATAVEFPGGEPAFQTGTVAGNLTLTARLRSSGADIVPTPVAVHSIRVERASPVITSARFSRTASGLEIQIIGYCTAREVTQAAFRFSATGSATLRNSEVSIPVEELFSRWFSDSAVAQFGSQFRFTQVFSIQGDAGAVTPVSVTLSNRQGSTTAEIRP